MLKFQNKAAVAVAGVGSLLAAMSASAAVDTTAIVAVITDAGTAAAAIGVAVLSMHYGIKLYRWIRGAG
ncbi:MAG: major capsid protein [Rhodanobacter sp.]